MALPNTATSTLDSQTNQGIPEATTTTNTGEPTMINAFHPDYMKTYEPDFMKDFRTVEANQAERKIKEPRKVIRPPRASVKIPKTGIRSSTPRNMTMAEVTAEILKTTTFHVYSRAGAAR